MLTLVDTLVQSEGGLFFQIITPAVQASTLDPSIIAAATLYVYT